MSTRSSGTPPTFSPNRPPPDLGKWGRPQGFVQRLSDVGSSPQSRTSASAFRDRRARDQAGDDPESRHDYRPKHSRMTSPNQTRWKRPPPFPMLPAGSKGSPRSLPRDTPPHSSNSVVHPFPSPSTAARPRRATREPKRYVESDRSALEEDLAEEAPFEGEISYSDPAREVLKESRARRSKVAHKERGSLKRTWDDDLPSRSRNRDTPTKVLLQNSKPKSKSRALNETKVEVFIPSIVSVGNLSRILGVSLGTQCVTRECSGYSLLD